MIDVNLFIALILFVMGGLVWYGTVETLVSMKSQIEIKVIECKILNVDLAEIQRKMSLIQVYEYTVRCKDEDFVRRVDHVEMTEQSKKFYNAFQQNKNHSYVELFIYPFEQNIGRLDKKHEGEMTGQEFAAVLLFALVFVFGFLSGGFFVGCGIAFVIQMAKFNFYRQRRVVDDVVPSEKNLLEDCKNQ
jgi:hypothetical protein